MPSKKELIVLIKQKGLTGYSKLDKAGLERMLGSRRATPKRSKRSRRSSSPKRRSSRRTSPKRSKRSRSKKNSGESGSYEDDFYRAVSSNNLHAVKKLLKDGVDPSKHYNAIIETTKKTNQLPMLKLLISDPRIDPGYDDNDIFLAAVYNKNTKVVEFLMKQKGVDPSARNDQALMRACEEAWIPMIKLLLKDKRVKPSKFVKMVTGSIERNGTPALKLLLDTGKVSKTEIKKALEFAKAKKKRRYIALLEQYV